MAAKAIDAGPAERERSKRPSRASRYSESRAWVRVRGRFEPEVIEARAGGRLRIVFRREETAPCSERVVIPSLGRSVMLPRFEDVVVELGPLPAGDYPFSCEFRVLQGHIMVRGDRATA